MDPGNFGFRACSIITVVVTVRGLADWLKVEVHLSVGLWQFFGIF